MGRGSSGRTMAASMSTPEWREAFRSGEDFISSGDVDHDRRRVSYELQQEWDRFTRDYQDGVTDRDMRDLMKEFDPRTGSVYGYVRTTNSFRINEKLYMPGGTKAYAVGRNAQESEVIFGRHANTRLMKVTVADDGHIVLHEMFTGYRRR